MIKMMETHAKNKYCSIWLWSHTWMSRGAERWNFRAFSQSRKIFGVGHTYTWRDPRWDHYRTHWETGPAPHIGGRTHLSRTPLFIPLTPPATFWIQLLPIGPFKSSIWRHRFERTTYHIDGLPLVKFPLNLFGR